MNTIGEKDDTLPCQPQQATKQAATVAAPVAVHLTCDRTHHYQAAENRQIGSEKKSR